MDKQEIDKACNISFFSEEEICGLILAEANKGRPYVESSEHVNGVDFLRDFRDYYKPELETENDKFWTGMFEDYMTQPVMLCLAERIGTHALRTPTPLIVSGDMPTRLYRVTERFMEDYATQIKSSSETIKERKKLEETLNLNWRSLAGTEIDRIRAEIKSKQTLAMDEGLLEKMTEVLRRVEDNRKVIDVWASLRRGSKNSDQFECGWVQREQTYRY